MTERIEIGGAVAGERKPPTMSPQLSNAERERLLKVARLREKVAKTAAGERATAMIADFEQQLASCYRFDQDVTWKAAHDAADRIVEEARRKIGDRCAELGIPERFASDLGLRWYSRGENASKERRAELRKIAVTRIVAIERQARAEIERISSQAQIELLAHGLSPMAQALLEQLPQVDKLMSTLQVEEVEALRKPRLAHY